MTQTSVDDRNRMDGDGKREEKWQESEVYSVHGQHTHMVIIGQGRGQGKFEVSVGRDGHKGITNARKCCSLRILDLVVTN